MNWENASEWIVDKLEPRKATRAMKFYLPTDFIFLAGCGRCKNQAASKTEEQKTRKITQLTKAYKLREGSMLDDKTDH